MLPATLLDLLERVASSALSPADALAELRDFPNASLPEAQATLDTHRALRTGQPEVVFGQGKSLAQLRQIVPALVGQGAPVLVTRLEEGLATALLEAAPGGIHNPLARTLVYQGELAPPPQGPELLIVSAGTSDTPVAEEAAVSAEVAGAQVGRISDVGVAGLHRILNHNTRLREAGVIVVVAGMEGALPTVVAGLSGRPVIAVPTSVGYGASFGGLAALLGMLNSCASGVSVVNIDNGFGAGQLGARLTREMG